MLFRSRLAGCVLLPLAFATGVARAAGPDFQFSGFGTLAATYADTDLAEFRTSWQQARGSRQRVDWGVDSRLGAQFDASFGDTFSASGQALAQRLGQHEELAVEWLYGQAQLGPDTLLRVGRVVLTPFMLSDVRKVGYAQHWARTPYEVYLTLPPADGAQLLYRTSWEGFKFSVQPTAGRGEADMYYDFGPFGVQPAHTSFHRIYALNLMVERGSWTVRLGHTVSHATIEWPFGPAEPLRYTFTSLGVQYDDGSLLAMAEMMRGKTDSGRYDIGGESLSTGYRFGAWMPYATHAQLKNTGSATRDVPVSRTTALGLRWDLRKDVALKFEAERSRLSGQQFIAVTLGTDLARYVRVYTLALDFVF